MPLPRRDSENYDTFKHTAKRERKRILTRDPEVPVSGTTAKPPALHPRKRAKKTRQKVILTLNHLLFSPENLISPPYNRHYNILTLFKVL